MIGVFLFLLFCFIVTYCEDSAFMTFLRIALFVAIVASIIISLVGRRLFCKKLEPEISILERWKKNAIDDAESEYANSIGSISSTNPLERSSEISRIKYEKESRLETIESEYKIKLRDLFHAKGIRYPFD